MSDERACKTCRWWDMHSIDMKLGTCRHEVDGIVHRYWKVPMPDGSFAMLDSFEPAETKPNQTCGAWERGDTEFA
jgi:hypothetical protein